MKKSVQSLLILTSLLFGTAYAGNTVYVGTVSRILPSLGTINFRLNIDGSCAPQHSSHYFKVASDDPDKKDYYAMLLWAAHTQTTVLVSGDEIACGDDQVSSTIVRYIFQDF